MKATIYTIISAPIAFAWAYVFTFEAWFAALMAIGFGFVAYIAGTIEEDEDTAKDRREVGDRWKN